MARYSNAASRAANDARAALVDGGSGAGRLLIYEGTTPTDCETAIGSQTLLATVVLDDPAFGASTDTAPGASAAAANLPRSDNAIDATGTAQFCRLVDSNGVVIVQGSVGATGSGRDLEVNSTSFVRDATFTITSTLNLTQPEGTEA